MKPQPGEFLYSVFCEVLDHHHPAWEELDASSRYAWERLEDALEFKDEE